MHSVSYLKFAQYHIFCTVIDNYGDIATCWRLALALTVRHAISVKIWVDELDALKQLLPEIDTQQAHQVIQTVEISLWSEALFVQTAAPIVIEAFGCQLPENYRQAMIRQNSLCMNLEYFSCEEWVLGCHGLRSYQSDGLHKYFFFPGIMPGTGGILFEADYEQQRLAFTQKKQLDWFERWQLPRTDSSSVRISLFGYENTAILSLLKQASEQSTPIEFYCPISKLCNQLHAHFSDWQISPGHSYKLGHCTIHFISFLPQVEYDRLLWSCDLNFVRGEESLIRGLLAAKPLVWQIYPTDDQAHWLKLNAFFKAYTMEESLCQLNHAWNAQSSLDTLMPVITNLTYLKQLAEQQQQHILSLGDLSTNLVRFIEDKMNGERT